MTLNFSPMAVERSCPYNSPRKYRILRMSCSTVDSASPVCSIDSGSGGANGSGPCTLMQRIFHQVRGEEYSCLWLIGFWRRLFDAETQRRRERPGSKLCI